MFKIKKLVPNKTSEKAPYAIKIFLGLLFLVQNCFLASAQQYLSSDVSTNNFYFWRNIYLFNPAAAGFEGKTTISSSSTFTFQKNIEPRFLLTAIELPVSKKLNFALSANRFWPYIHLTPSNINDFTASLNVSKPASFGVISFGIMGRGHYHSQYDIFYKVVGWNWDLGAGIFFNNANLQTGVAFQNLIATPVTVSYMNSYGSKEYNIKPNIAGNFYFAYNWLNRNAFSINSSLLCLSDFKTFSINFNTEMVFAEKVKAAIISRHTWQNFYGVNFGYLIKKKFEVGIAALAGGGRQFPDEVIPAGEILAKYSF